MSDASLDPSAAAVFDARFDAAVAAVAERRAEHERHDRARRILWRTHHWPDQYERCTVIAGRHVCRRCLTLYPLAFLVAAAAAWGLSPWPVAVDPALIWLSALPATVEFVAEQTGLVRYSPRRQVLVTALLALGVGRGFAHELDTRWSPLFWGPVAVGSTIWFVAALVGRRRASGHADSVSAPAFPRGA